MDKVFLHHDKASSHTSNKTQQFLQEMKDTLGLNFIRNSDIPVKSPDASPLDFYGFGGGRLALPFANKLPANYAVFAGLVRQSNLSFFNLSLADLALEQPSVKTADHVTSIPAIKVFCYCVYIVIFLLGISGNVLVCYVVFRNSSMHTVTNLFISNLALSDILLCMFAVPFTPMYYYMGEKLYREMVSNQLLLDALDAKMEEAKIKLNEEPIFKKMSKEAVKKLRAPKKFW
ncbi:PRLHR [Cordylochernes scorpioides]|uniref:PRLHR n=1 Tax=Cordylochernes scorpioides TaxID=51811 RepID=A0ABY6L5L8_9ARAC|nr:PRLHR [Cordylochernes scorpioides]